MSAQVAAPAPGRARADAGASARRGRLVLADKVVEKIAGQAAAEVHGVLGREGGVLGIGTHADADARPRADVDLGRESADVSLVVGVVYPMSIRRVTGELRQHVANRVEQLTGVPVHRVDVDVRFLLPPATGEDLTERGLR